jgi:sulfonate transport system permease protein
VAGFSVSYWLIGLSFLLTAFLSRYVLSGQCEARRRTAVSTPWRGKLKTLLTHPEVVETGLIEVVANSALLFYAVFIIAIAIDQFHCSKGEASALLAVQGLSYMAALFLLGGLFERLGKVLFYGLSFAAAWLGLLTLGTADSVFGLWVGAALLGFGLGLTSLANVVRLATVSAELGQSNVAGAQGLAGPLGALLGSIGGGALGHSIGLQNVFLLLAAATASAALLVLVSHRRELSPAIGRALLSGLIKLWPALNRAAAALAVPGALLWLWWLSSLHGWVSPQILPAPPVVFNTLLELIDNGDIPDNLLISLGRVAKGFALGSLSGLLLGFAMGLSRKAEAYIGPLFKALSSVPVLGWVPVMVVLVGIDEGLKVAVIAIGCVVPVTLNTFEGVRGVPRGFVEVGRVFQFSHWQLLRKVVLPAALPSLYTGISLAISHAWKALVAVELIASSEGIGFLMVMGRQLFQLDVVLATILVIGLVGLLLDQALRLSERHFMRWRKSGV